MNDLTPFLAYYEEREEDARACAKWIAQYAVSEITDVARRYLSGDYPKK